MTMVSAFDPLELDLRFRIGSDARRIDEAEIRLPLHRALAVLLLDVHLSRSILSRISAGSEKTGQVIPLKKPKT